ncbi:MAG: zinc ribbon domain-containing protein [Candidatus Gracilibacteria bacterium]|nr:zinc ribbon domain-containing protein [Candidatus Gracilibacteria bacterium]
MKTKKILLIIFTFIFFLLSFNFVNASINLSVSPIKEEIQAEIGTTITNIAKLTNHTNETLHIYTGKSDFEPNGDNGKPKFIRKSELVNPNQQLAEWININTTDFYIEPGETIEIEYTITVPSDATPGGHYGAVFFKNNSSETSGGAAVSINVDYGVLVLVNVAGEVKTDIDIKDPVILGNIGAGSKLERDKCPMGDLSRSYYDGICIDKFEDIINGLKGDKKDNTNTQTGETQDRDFNISFEIPIENTGNTHIKPSGKIILVDENGNELKEVGKEIITNDKGAIIGEKIVDYIPINDFGGNILPGSERKYQCDWKGFGFKTYDEGGNEIVDYWDPSEYYTNKNKKEAGFLMFWERVCERQQNKKITAIFDISYLDENGELIEYNAAKDFYIDYTEEYIGLNPYVIIPLSGLALAIFTFWIIAILKRKKCPNCKKRVKKDMKICPYCGEKLKKGTPGRKKKK